MGDNQEACNTGLHLALGIGELEPMTKSQNNRKPVGGLSFSLAIKEEEKTAIEATLKSYGSSFTCSCEEDDEYRQQKNIFRSKVETKKLRLTKEQSSLLETSFEFRNTLHPAQKQALSKELGLKPRQIEVWFQNRRARTKLKQTETDCELLKQWCRCLLNENRRLKIELQNLRPTNVESSPSIYMNRVSKAGHALTTCPNCGDDPNVAWSGMAGDFMH